MTKVQETARVLSFEGGRAEVVMAGAEDAARCAACVMASHCGARERRFTVEAPEGTEPGDEVTVEIEAPSPALAAFLLFILPLAVAFSAAGAVYWLSRSEALGVFAGLAGAAAVYLTLYLTRLGSRTAGRVVTRSEVPRRPS